MLDYHGIPFTELGRTRAGCDCLGLVMLIYREKLGIALPEPGYAHTKDNAIPTLVDQNIIQWRKVDYPECYDVALFHGFQWHVGVMVDSNRMLHVSQEIESGVDYLEPLWTPSLIGFSRYAG